VVLVLSFIGSYALNASMFDVYVCIAFGLLGYLMHKMNFPSAPLILGLILGGIAEGGLMRSFVMARGNIFAYFFSRPACLVLMALIVLSVFAPFIQSFISKEYSGKREEA